MTFKRRPCLVDIVFKKINGWGIEAVECLISRWLAGNRVVSMAQLKVVLVDELVTYLDQGRLDIASKVLDGVHLPSLLKLLSVPWIHPRSTTEKLRA